MRTVDRMISRLITERITIVAIWLMAVYTFLALLDLIRTSNEGETIYHHLYVLGLSAPTMLYELSPMIFVIGTTVALAGFSRDLGFVALQAGGVSKFRITATIVVYSLFFALLMFIWGELVVPNSESAKARHTESQFVTPESQLDDQSLWTRDGDQFVFFQSIQSLDRITGIQIYEFDDKGQFKHYIHARFATQQDNEDLVKLHEVVTTRFTDNGVERQYSDSIDFESSVKFNLLVAKESDPFLMKIGQLYSIMKYLRDNNLETDFVELAFWNRLTIPISVLVMALFAVIFTFRTRRGLSRAHFAVIGLVFGLIYFAVQQSAGYVVILNGLAPIIGTFGTLLLFLVCAIIVLRRV